MAHLRAIEGILAGQDVDLADGMTVGRAEGNELWLEDLAVSRRHARIDLTEEGVVVEDLDSGNGTFVNERRIEEPTVLRDRDVVTFGKQVFRFVDPEQRPEQEISVLDMEESLAQVEGTIEVASTMAGGVYSPQVEKDATKANERLRTMLRISNAVHSELDMNALLQKILEGLFEVFPQADRGFVMLYDGEGELRPAASRNRRGQVEEITISRHIVEEVTSRRVAVLSRDAMDDDRFGGAMSIVSYNIRSMMCAPLATQEDLLGIIHVDTTSVAKKFTQDDLDLLTGVAAQTALAVGSARMHQRLLARDRMERDLRVARQVQESFLPHSLPEVPGLEFAPFYRAAQEVGGDLYDFVRQGEDSLAVVVGDVSGKGIPAALMMARMSSDARFFSVQTHDPRDVLAHMNRRMDEVGMPDVFATMVHITIDLGTHQVLVGNAAHCLPLVRRAAQGDVVEVSPEPGFPLGVLPETDFDQFAYRLQPGDVVCLVTDGVTEAMDADKNQYGDKRLKETVAAAPASAQGVLDAVLEDVDRHVGQTPQSDDLTCVCFGVTDRHSVEAEAELGLAQETEVVLMEEA